MDDPRGGSVGLKPGIGKLLYAALFVVLLPVGIVVWAAATGDAVPLPVIPYSWAGVIPIGLGAFLMLAGGWALRVYGHGLPMSPYPPPVYVTRGVFRFLAHPIYVGFSMLLWGAAILTRSPSGLWLVAPALTLGCVALVLGHEHHELRRRFGPSAIARRLIALPPPTDEHPTGWDRASVVLLVLLPWSAAFEAVYRLGVPIDAVQAYLPFERSWPVLEWTEAIYGSAYILVVGALFAARTRAALRRYAVEGLIATAGVTLVYLTVPLVAPPRPFEPQGILGHALMGERAMSHTVAAFPAFHAIWSFIAAEAWASRSRWVALFAWTWAVLIAASCITTGMHATADIIAATAVFLLVRRYRDLWELLRRFAERVANSWRAWSAGPVRFIVHGVYAALAAATGFTIAATFAGPDVYWRLVFVHFATLLGAALWAQTLEGSSKLSRPFGYYGGVVGGVGGSIVIGVLFGDTMLLLAALALAAPWAQAIGRLRCLVQGCCHGSTAPEALGIRYFHVKSRVLTLGDLAGVPLHPTPLYSILTNVVIGSLLLRLWSLSARLSMVVGVYLILTGVARFVEESYRGEPQTPIVGGLRIYQWLAIISFAAGAIVTTLSATAAPGWNPWLDVKVPVTGLLFGACAGFAMGVDFPRSARRFARLADP
jgi:protein-S-isoprenylcysteine O-methyltransferase Ste14